MRSPSTSPPPRSLPPKPHSPRISPEAPPSASGIHRSRSAKSVQFSTSPDTRDMASEEEISPGGGARRRISAQAESSGDEITPFAQRERGSQGRNYEAMGSRGSKSAGEEVGTGTDDAGARKRRRKRVAAGDGNGDGVVEEEGWWARLVEKLGSVELENRGSVARDHLALERTFLAWLRTSLSFAGIGIAITQLFRLNTTITEREGYTPANPAHSTHLRQLGKPLGATFLGIAILVLLVGGRRYAESQYWIIRGKFPASRGSVFLVTAITVALIVTSLVVVLTVAPSAFEKRR